MKKAAAVILSLLILLSSGLFQFVVHVCPEEGAMLSAEQCYHHEKAVDDCCKRESISLPEDDCCTTEFVFAITAKFNSVYPVALPELVAQPLFINSYPTSDFVLQPKTRLTACNSSPPDAGRDLLLQSSILII